MLTKALKIAIYSGEIPSTTFIERLITGITTTGTHVILFGAFRSKPKYNSRVKVVVYRATRLSKFWHLFRFGLLLTLFKPKEKKRLDTFLKQRPTSDLYDKVKYYPVLWYHPDVFHIQWAKGLDDWMWVKEFGIKLVLSLRGAHINYSPIANVEVASMYKRNFPKVDAFHAVSEAIAIEATKYGGKMESIQVIKSGLRLDEFTFKLREFKSNASLNILSIGRDHWIKNYRVALDAIFRLRERGIPFFYTIVGVSENEALIFQRKQLGLENEVHFLDTLAFNEVRDAIQQADVLFLPSLKEGIANVVLEAMALGTLVVSTDCGGMAEVVIPNETGFLVPNRDAQAMTNALMEVAQLSLMDYQNLTSNARLFVEQHHNEDHMVAQMQLLYDGVISRTL